MHPILNAQNFLILLSTIEVNITLYFTITLMRGTSLCFIGKKFRKRDIWQFKIVHIVLKN